MMKSSARRLMTVMQRKSTVTRRPTPVRSRPSRSRRRPLTPPNAPRRPTQASPRRTVPSATCRPMSSHELQEAAVTGVISGFARAIAAWLLDHLSQML